VLVTSPDGHMAAITDSEGRFSFDLRRIDPQTATQAFSSYPFTPAAAAATIPVQFSLRKPGYIGNNVTVHVAAAPSATPEPALQLKIVPAAVLTGHLEPESGDLPANTNVMLEPKVVLGGIAHWGFLTAQVNSHGDFRFGHLPPGDFKLVAPASVPQNQLKQPLPNLIHGFRPSFYPNATSFDSAGVIHLGPGESAYASLTYRNANFYNVTIPVTGLADNRAFYAVLLPDGPGLALSHAGNTAQGYLPSGSYDVQLRSDEPGTSPARIPTVSIASAHLQVDNKPVRTDPVALHPAFEVPVEVRAEFANTTPPQTDPHNPSPLAWVSLQPVVPAGLNPMVQNLPGGTVIQNLSEGLFRVEISSAVVGYVASATSGTTDLLREPLRVIPGVPPRPIEVTLRDDSATLNARLAPAANMLPQASDDQPVYILCIPLDRPEAQAFNYTITRDDFSIPNLAPGRYLILATHQQLNQPAQPGLAIEYRNEEAIPSLIPKGVTVTLSPNQKADIEVPLMPEDAN
jgi:hypothetical protein